MKFNLADQRFHVITFDADGRVTGEEENITCQIKIDNGPRVATNDVNPSEIGTTGEYVFNLTQAETAGHALSFTPVCSTPGVQVLGVPSNVIYTFDGGASLVGDFTLTVTVTDADSGDPIEGATITLSRTGQRGAKLTDASGVAVVGLDAATWSWIVRAAGYEDRTGTIAISGNAVLSVEMDGIVGPVDITAETTALTFRVSSQGNVSLAGIVASARLIGEGLTVVGETVGVNVVEESTSDSGGVVTLVLFRERDYDLSIRRPNGTIYKIRITTGAGPSTLISAAIEI